MTHEETHDRNLLIRALSEATDQTVEATEEWLAQARALDVYMPPVNLRAGAFNREIAQLKKQRAAQETQMARARMRLDQTQDYLDQTMIILAPIPTKDTP